MYSDHPIVNQLTALLVAHGVTDAVVCPGSRNAPIVHNFDVCPQIRCHGVTDERSAGFYAMGMAQALGHGVAVCVSSGSALLGVLPAVVEASFQHVPMVVISADRPGAWIGQLDGQTLPQPEALRQWVRCAVSLPERNDEEGHWHANRLVNEALTAMQRGGGGPVHINVPLNEPLFGFHTPALPHERKVTCVTALQGTPCLTLLSAQWREARRRMVVIGQLPPGSIGQEALQQLSRQAVIVHEALCDAEGGVAHPDEVVSLIAQDTEAQPDFILYVGGAVVSKPFKRYLRGLTESVQWRVDTDGTMPDTFAHLTGLVEGHPGTVIRLLADATAAENDCHTDTPYLQRWQDAESEVTKRIAHFATPYSQAAVVQYLEQQLSRHDADWQIHYANSSAVRLANRYARHHVWCNRGVNGIEGSLSTAAGFALVHPGRVLCVTGDLSFFYDQNALWPETLGGNLRILLLNNGCGGIFSRLPGLEASPASHTWIAASHHATAKGICTQWGIGYQEAHDMEHARTAVDTLLNEDSRRPLLAEIFTTPDQDNNGLQL